MLDIVNKNNNESMSSRAAIGVDGSVELSLPLAKAVRDITKMMVNHASCDDIALATVQCTANMLPGCNAVFIAVSNDLAEATVLATANAPFAVQGDAVAISADSILTRALLKPQRSHRGTADDVDQLFPNRKIYPVEEDDVIMCKAILRDRAEPLVLSIITQAINVTVADSILTTLGDLLLALCTGYDATLSNEQSQVAIFRAKREWEQTVDTLNDLVCLTREDGRILRANRTTERWHLSSVKAVRGIHIHDLLHPGCKHSNCALADAVSPTADNGERRFTHATIVSDERLNRVLSVRSKFIPRNTDGESAANDASVVIVLSDVTALHRARDELKSLNEELEGRVRDRTLALEMVNQDLTLEIERRCRAESELQASRDELELLSQQLINAQEDERTRLSRELHDSIGQSLGAVKYTLERISSAGGKLSAEESGVILGNAIHGVTEAIKDTRSIAMRLRPPILDDMGAVAAVRWLVTRFSETYPNLEFHLELTVAVDEIPQPLATPLYRIVQEALNNVVKHASATSALVSLQRDDQHLVLEVVDDGIGFDAEIEDTGAFRKLGNFGRLGMRERALNSNGILTITSSPGDGTRVQVEWEIGIETLQERQTDD